MKKETKQLVELGLSVGGLALYFGLCIYLNKKADEKYDYEIRRKISEQKNYMNMFNQMIKVDTKDLEELKKKLEEDFGKEVAEEIKKQEFKAQLDGVKTLSYTKKEWYTYQERFAPLQVDENGNGYYYAAFNDSKYYITIKQD